MQIERARQPVFGFILCGTGLGAIAGVILAYAPDYLHGAYELPTVANAYYWMLSLGGPPVIGFIAGLLVDVLVDGQTRRKDLLRKWWSTFFIACFALFLLAGTYGPAY